MSETTGPSNGRPGRTGAGRWLASALLALAACGPGDGTAAVSDADPARGDWPPGTILALDGVPLLAEEVAEGMVPVLLIDPNVTDKHRRRLALTNVALPRTIARILAGDRRESARREIEAWHARAVAGELPGPPGPDGEYATRIEGSWRELGMLAWGAAFELEPGAWSDVIEEVGMFQVVRVLERQDGPVPEATRFVLDVRRVVYLPPGVGTVEIEAAKDRIRLTIVDPEWRTIVPELDQYRMGVHE